MVFTAAKVYVVIIKAQCEIGVFVDKSAAANFLSIHRNTITNRLRENKYYEDDNCIIGITNIIGSGKGGYYIMDNRKNIGTSPWK